MKRTTVVLVLATLILPSFAAADEYRFSTWYGSNSVVFDSLLADVAGFIDAADTKRGGTAFGVDVWLGERFQWGLGVAYLPIFANNFSTSFTVLFITINTNVQTQVDETPMMLQFRYFPWSRIYLGGGAGISGYRIKADGDISLWFIPVKGAGGADQSFGVSFELMAGLIVLQDAFGQLSAEVRAYSPWPLSSVFRASIVSSLTLSVGF